jgi:hypothetical protein
MDSIQFLANSEYLTQTKNMVSYFRRSLQKAYSILQNKLTTKSSISFRATPLTMEPDPNCLREQLGKLQVVSLHLQLQQPPLPSG